MKQKEVIQLSPTGYYLGKTKADESPLEPDVYMMPAHTIDGRAPTLERTGYVYKWNGTGWDEEVDHRGTAYWDANGREHMVHEIGGVVPAGASLTNPMDAEDPTTPRAVDPRQVRLLLLSKGLLDEVEAMIAQQDRATQIAWEFAPVFMRDDPILVQLAANLNLTPEQIDLFFWEASQL